MVVEERREKGMKNFVFVNATTSLLFLVNINSGSTNVD